jgi:hypothetical protein
LSYKRTRISVNGRELRVPEVALIYRNPDDVIPEFPKTFLYFETFPLVRDEVIKPLVQTEIKYEKMKDLSYQEVSTTNIEDEIVETSKYVTHLSITNIVIIGLALMILFLYLKFSYCNKSSVPTGNNTVLYVPSREAP